MAPRWNVRWVIVLGAMGRVRGAKTCSHLITIDPETLWPLAAELDYH